MRFSTRFHRCLRSCPDRGHPHLVGGVRLCGTPHRRGCSILQHTPLTGCYPPCGGWYPPGMGVLRCFSHWLQLDNQNFQFWRIPGYRSDSAESSLVDFLFVSDKNASMNRQQKPPMPIDISQLVPLPEAAKIADISEVWLRQLVREDKVKGVRIGRYFYVNIESAKAFHRHPYLGRPRGVEKSTDEVVKKPRKQKGKKQ